jgi:MoaA/NifB/PqqE/SkfB family radical SAM enzyme
MLNNSIKGRTIKNLGRGLFNKSSPSYLILYVNNICQLRCDMCFYWDAMQKKTKQLSLHEITKLAKSLPNLLQLTLTGGEPSLRKDITEIPKIFSKYSNLSKCTMVTNGMLHERIREQVNTFVNENKNVDFRISISMDGIGDLHDKIRGVEGSFSNAEKTLNLLFKIREQVPNLWIDIATTISKYNYEKFEEIHNYIITNYPIDNHGCTFTRGNTKETDAKEIPIEYYTKAKELIAKNRKLRDHPFQKITSIVTDTVRNEVERELKTNKMAI